MLSQVSRPVVGLRWVAIAYWAALFVAGLAWFIVGHRREAERVKVLRSLSSSGGISVAVSAAVPKRPLLLRAADSVVSAVKKVAKSGPSE